mmetsp:Transcript_90933/g.273131  ORF Transcript_90933/g.273131 Transcript_90933/m.273131 type:complete len:222 (+) Transcript_90933:2-667(+)
MRLVWDRLAAVMRVKAKRMPWFACWESYFSWQPSSETVHGIVRSEAQTFCVSAGLTKVTRSKHAASVYAHRHAFAKGKSGNRQVKSLFGGSLLFMNQERKQGSSPIRARSVTSDAMLHVTSANATSGKKSKRLPDALSSESVPSILRAAFNVSAAELGVCNAYMVRHETQIAHSKATEMPNRCFKGFACKKQAKPENMVLRSGRWVTLEQAKEWAKRGITT